MLRETIAAGRSGLAGLFMRAGRALLQSSGHAERQAAVGFDAAGDPFPSAIIASALDCIVTADESGRIVDFNPAAERTFGLERAAVIGKELSDTIVPEHLRDRHRAGMARFVAGGAPRMLGRRVEVEGLRSDGTVFPLELAVVEAPVGGGRLFISFMRDLTQQKAAEAQLRQSEARLSAFMRHAPTTMFLKDAEGRYLVANEEAARNLGCRVEDMIGRTIRDVGPSDLAAYTEAAERDVLARGHAVVGVQSFRLPRGMVHGLTTRFPVPDATGALTGIGGVYIDITAQKEAEERLRESERRFRALSEYHPVALVIMRLPDRRVLLVNPAFQRLVRLPDDTDVGEIDAERWFETPEECERVIAAALGGAVGDGLEARMRSAAGSFWASISWRHADYDGQPAVVMSILDVTDRKQAEAELASSREALHQTEKLTALGSLLAGVSHELNNPLAIVVGEALILEEDTEGTPLAPAAGRIKRAAERCSRIVQTFLAMARQRKPERHAVDAARLAAGALELTAYGLRTMGVRVEQDFAEGLPPIWGDPDQLHQVLVNIIVNAQQAMQDSPGERALAVRTRPGSSPGTVSIEIADNGPGVPPNLRERIFEPFFTTKPHGVGTGVGLSFCQGIVQGHGGTLTLVPSQTGAVFRLDLPAADGASAAPPAPASQPGGSRRKGRALVVDDEPELGRTLATLLEREGYAVEVAEGGRAALARLAAGDYDVVLSDLRMPDVDGPALYAWIEANRPALRERIAFVTGDTLGTSAARFLARVDRPVVEKPFTRQTIRDLLADLERRRDRTDAAPPGPFA
jgi:PAS domain S-box-containing protein